MKVVGSLTRASDSQDAFTNAFTKLTDVTSYVVGDANKIVQVNSSGTGIQYGNVLGTASVANTGTSGTALPFLDGANTWSANQIFGAISATASSATPITVTQSLASSNAASVLDLSTTWNTTGTPIAIKLNVTDTASNANSLLIDLQVAASSKFKVSKAGDVTAGASIRATNHLVTGATSAIWFDVRSRIYSPADGNIQLTNAAVSDFGLLQFGGTSSSFPALKRSGSLLLVRLADDTGYAGIQAGSLAATNLSNQTVLSASHSLTGSNSASIFSLLPTWNTSGTPTAMFLNITDTASNAASLLMDLQVGGTSQFKVSKAGVVTVVGTIGASNFSGSHSGTSSGTNTGDQTTVTGNAGTATALQTGRTISISGDLTYTSPTFDGTGNVTAAGTLATVNSNVGTFGSTSAVPIITVNGKGLITAVTTASLGTAAVKNTGTSGNTVPLLDSVNTWSGAQTINANLTLGSTGSLYLDNAAYIRTKLNAGTATRMLGINASDAVYLGGIDATIANILLVSNGVSMMSVAPTATTISGSVTMGGTLTVNGSGNNVIKGRTLLYADGTALSADLGTTYANFHVGSILVGSGDSSASPTTGNLRAPDGTGTDISGATLQIKGGRSTGAGTGGPVVFMVSGSTTTGSGSNSPVERARVTAAGLSLTGNLVITPVADTSAISSTGYSVTGSGTTSIVDLAGTWNTTGDVSAIKLNITNTASGTNANLVDLQVGGTSQFKVSKAGAGTFVGAIAASNFSGSHSGTSSGTNTGDQTTITGNAGTATTLQTGRTISITGDLAYTSPTFNGSGNVTAAGTLATVNSNVGTFGSTSTVPIVTVNAKGLVTAVTTASLGTAAVKNTGTSGNTVPLLDGTNTWTNGQTFSSSVNINGDLTVAGTTFTINATNLEVSDAIISLARNNSSAAVSYIGIKAERGSTDAYLVWDETNDVFVAQTATDDAQSGAAQVPFKGSQFISTVSTGTAPLTVASTTVVTNLNADLLDGQQGSFYQNASNINTGTLAVTSGGTGIISYTANNYVRAATSTTLEQRTPAQVRTDISATQSSYGSSAPVSPNYGDRWIDDTSGIEYVYYYDGNSAQWVQFGSTGTQYQPVYIQSTRPTNASGAFLWVQTNYGGSDDFTIWFDDGT